MLVSKQWLEQFVDLSGKTPEDLEQDLTLRTVEVEGVTTLGELLTHVVVGAVSSVEKHPDADRLNVCQVDIGNEEVQIVCGGSNVSEGMKVALGKVGAFVQWHGEGDPVELKPTKIRGVESFGMICASDEIGLGELFPKADEKEILDLSHLSVEIGMPLQEALAQNDVVIDIDNKSMTHRPDLWGHYGLARELAAMYKRKLKPLAPATIREGKESLSVEIKEKDLCKRYMAIALDGVTVGSSPTWMQARLQAVGIRPINNIVDITNYVMLEVGQPMHAFDRSKLGKKIIIRLAEQGEDIQTLDEQDRTLSRDMLVIADENHAVAIAGIMGGANTDVDENTTAIVLEAATFDPIHVRRTSAALGLRSDSSARFEKSLDPALPELALKRAVELIKEAMPEAQVTSKIADEKKPLQKPAAIDVSVEYISQRIGEQIAEKEMIDILERLSFDVKAKKGVLSVTPPSWRATKDISIKEDIVEEVVRMHGYNAVEPTLPPRPIAPAFIDPLQLLIRRTTGHLAIADRFTEARNYSFVKPEWLGRLDINTRQHIELDNPVAKDRPLVRRSLLPNLLENVEKNTHRFDEVRLFEVGRVYLIDKKGKQAEPQTPGTLPKQDAMLGLVSASKDTDTPFFDLSQSIVNLCAGLGMEANLKQMKKSEYEFLHPGRSAIIEIDGEQVGMVAELHPKYQQALGIPFRTALAELNLDMLVPLVQDQESYNALPTFPSMTRDIAFVVGKQTSHKDIEHAIHASDELVSDVELFDVFDGKGIEPGQKSVAYRVTYQSADRTLETSEVDKKETALKETLRKQFDAQIRD